MFGPLASSQASAICEGVAPLRSASPFSHSMIGMLSGMNGFEKRGNPPRKSASTYWVEVSYLLVRGPVRANAQNAKGLRAGRLDVPTLQARQPIPLLQLFA